MIDDVLHARWASQQPSWWVRLSGFIREKADATGGALELTEPDLSELVPALPHRGVSWRLDRLLRLIRDAGPRIGRDAYVGTPADLARLWLHDREELRFLLQALQESERIYSKGDAGDEAPGQLRVMLRPKGWLRLEEIEVGAGSDLIFVAMWFTDELRPAGKAISAAIVEAGYTPHLLLNQPAHGDRIDAKILVDIRRSRGLIVDATGPLLENGKACARPSVTYEGGFAEGLGKPVIWTVRDDQVDHLPFDTRQLLHVPWKAPADLAEKLRPVIEARFGIRKP